MKKNIMLVLLAVIVTFTAGCGLKEAAKEQESKEAKPFTVIKDQMDREVVIGSLPERVVSLAPGNTEIAFAVGLDKKIVGVTDFCDYPAEAKTKEKVGGFANPNIEAVIALKPDLVLAGNKHEEIVKKLEELGIPVLIISPESLEEVYTAMQLVAEASGNADKTAAVIADMKGRIQKIEDKLAAIADEKKARVYYEVYSNPLMSAGKLSLIHEVITLAGGKNIFADISERYPKINEEAVVERNPQFILFPQLHGSEEIKGDIFAKRPVWAKMTAVKENRIYGVQADAISRPGPRLVDAVEEVAALLYPDMFK